MITKASEDFNWEYRTLGDPKLEKILAAVKPFASAMQRGESPHWLSLLGSSGIGKTHLSKKLAEFWDRHCGTRIISASMAEPIQTERSRLISWRTFVREQRGGDFQGINRILAARFAILDDIGTEHDPSGFAKAVLDEILDARLGKWTVVTSNLYLDQLAAIDSRIASRLVRDGSKVLAIEGVPDFNLRPK